MAIGLAICFIALIECITYIHNNSAGLYLNWLYIIYAYTSLFFCMIASRNNYVSMYAYVLFALAYIVFAFADTLTEFNAIASDAILSNNYGYIMNTLIAILSALSIYDRLDTVKHGAVGLMSKPCTNPYMYSKVST
jgi:hypothetical protein